MRVSHEFTAVFDDPNLVPCGGLGPVARLAERGGLRRLVSGAGMVAGADSICDMDLLRHGGMGRLFGGVRAPPTLGTFLRCRRSRCRRQVRLR